MLKCVPVQGTYVCNLLSNDSEVNSVSVRVTVHREKTQAGEMFDIFQNPYERSLFVVLFFSTFLSG